MIPYDHNKWKDFSKEENQKAMKAALEKVKEDLGKEYPLLIDGEEVYTSRKLVSYNPADKKQVVGKVSMADKELAEKAINSAWKHFETWAEMAG